jgi:hypothetical protein
MIFLVLPKTWNLPVFMVLDVSRIPAANCPKNPDLRTLVMILELINPFFVAMYVSVQKAS